MLKRAEFGFKHFEPDANFTFALQEEDRVTKRPVRRLIPNPTVKADFAALLAGQVSGQNISTCTPTGSCSAKDAIACSLSSIHCDHETLLKSYVCPLRRCNVFSPRTAASCPSWLTCWNV
jgi:hypothetical protein